MQQNYKEPMIQSGLFSMDVINSIFQNVHEIYQVHCNLHKKLKRRVEEFAPPEDEIGQESISIFAVSVSEIELRKALDNQKKQSINNLPTLAKISDIFIKAVRVFLFSFSGLCAISSLTRWQHKQFPSMGVYETFCSSYTMMTDVLKKTIARNRGFFYVWIPIIKQHQN